MKIEAVIVCVDYADYLAETLPHNLPHFDRVVVVTAPHDVETQKLCRRLSTPYYATNVFFKDGKKFNKARGIDYGLGFVQFNDWIVHLDADTYLPPMTRRWLEWRPLDRESIYGIDRVNCVGFEKWRAHLAGEGLQHDYMCRVHVPSFPLLDRIAIRDYGGYLPIGFFQMWHGSLGRRYPIAKGDAEHTDVLHAIQWDEGKRHLIPEVVGIHLQAASAPLGANWKGRTTPRFGPATHSTSTSTPTPPKTEPMPPAHATTTPHDEQPVLYMG
jgi:hypothetical protein